MDDRYWAIRERLGHFSKTEIRRIVDDIDKCVFDEYNYKDGYFCPVGLAMNLHNELSEPTNISAKQAMARRFNPVNVIKGVPGQFYHGNSIQRRKDLLMLCDELLNES